MLQLHSNRSGTLDSSGRLAERTRGIRLTAQKDREGTRSFDKSGIDEMDRTTADGIRADQTIVARFFGRARRTRGETTVKRAFSAVNDFAERKAGQTGIEIEFHKPIRLFKKRKL